MIFKLRKFSLDILLVCGLTPFSGCVSGPHFYLQYGNEYREIDLERILAEHPLAPGENIKVANLGRSASASQHVVQIRDREVLRSEERRVGKEGRWRREAEEPEES